MENKQDVVFDKEILRLALMKSFVKLKPKVQIQNPVRFIVYLGAILASFVYLMTFWGNKDSSPTFILWVMVSLWLIVLAGNFVEALAEEISKLQTKMFKLNQNEASLYKVAMLKWGRCDKNEGTEKFLDSEKLNKEASITPNLKITENYKIDSDNEEEIKNKDRIGTCLGINKTSKSDEAIKITNDSQKEATPNERALNFLFITLTFLAISLSCSLYFYFKFCAAQSGGNERVSITALISICSCIIPVAVSAMLLPIREIGLIRALRENIFPIDGESLQEASNIGALAIGPTEKEDVSIKSNQILTRYPSSGENIAILNEEDFGGNLVPVSNKISKLIQISKQTQIMMGILTLVGILSNIVQCLIIFPPLIMTLYPEIESLNIMKISKPENAILASLIYNLLFILVMILCLIKWNKFKSLFHSRLYLKITLLCTFVGIVMPFIGLKLIDGLITFWRIF